ncbi:MAG: beta-propeller fold lactonase family protein, partial [Clostridia bacterium]|nr:beta-propeller fold lactonase family protein [Clostridia bacterium]
MNFYLASLATENKGLLWGSLENNRITLNSVCDDIASRGYAIRSKDGSRLFSLSQKDGKEFVATYDIKNGSPVYIGAREIPGGVSCHLTESPDGKFIYVANYGKGTVDYVSTMDDTVGTFDCNESGNSKMHMVQFRPGTNELFAVDLGCNCIYIFDYDKETGALTKKSEIKTKEGGPRHLEFLSSDLFYLVYENANLVDVFAFENSVFTCKQSLSTLPDGCDTESYGAAIKIADGRLYISNRGHDSIMQYVLLADHSLKSLACFALDGSFPRDFAVIEDKLLVTFQKSDKVIL